MARCIRSSTTPASNRSFKTARCGSKIVNRCYLAMRGIPTSSTTRLVRCTATIVSASSWCAILAGRGANGRSPAETTAPDKRDSGLPLLVSRSIPDALRPHGAGCGVIVRGWFSHYSSWPGYHIPIVSGCVGYCCNTAPRPVESWASWSSQTCLFPTCRRSLFLYDSIAASTSSGI